MKLLSKSSSLARKISVLFLLIGMTFLYGCNAVSTSTSTTIATGATTTTTVPLANIAGNWVTSINGTLYPESNWQLYTTIATLEIAQTGSAVSGTFLWSDTQGMSGSDTFSGTITGNIITFYTSGSTTPEMAVASGNTLTLSGLSPTDGTPYAWVFTRQ